MKEHFYLVHFSLSIRSHFSFNSFELISLLYWLIAQFPKCNQKKEKNLLKWQLVSCLIPKYIERLLSNSNDIYSISATWFFCGSDMILKLRLVLFFSVSFIKFYMDLLFHGDVHVVAGECWIWSINDELGSSWISWKIVVIKGDKFWMMIINKIRVSHHWMRNNINLYIKHYVGIVENIQEDLGMHYWSCSQVDTNIANNYCACTWCME